MTDTVYTQKVPIIYEREIGLEGPPVKVGGTICTCLPTKPGNKLAKKC